MSAIDSLTRPSGDRPPELAPLDLADSHERLARHLQDEVTRALGMVGGCKDECLQVQAAIVSHIGSRPMSITWRLSNPIPGRWLQAYARLAS
jgi:hypothetical protein